MKRGLLLVLGFWGSLLSAMLLVSVASKGYEAKLYLPCDVEQTPLRIMELRSYDGPFVEDGSCREVKDVAAVVLFNPSEQFLARGAVKVWQEGRLMVFAFSCIPPGGRVLVLESSAKAYEIGRIKNCWGWCVVAEGTPTVQVEEVGRSVLAITNLLDKTAGEITVHYKNYDPEEKLYIGGISYSVTVYQVQPGHRVVVPAFMYLSGKSMVVK